MQPAARTRYDWIDVMKLIAIWLMYMAHYDGMGRYGMVGMYTVLGILFFCSGFTSFAKRGLAPAAFCREKFLRLIVPYFAFGVLALAVRVFLFELTIGDMIDWMRRLVWGARNVCPLAALWFLPCLFFMELYHYLTARFLKNRWLVLAAACCVSAAVKFIHEGAALPWGIDMAGRFWIYYAIGDVASQLWRQRREAGAKPSAGLRALGVCTALVSLYVLYVNFYYGLGYFPSLFGVQEAPFAVLSLITFLYECSGIVCALCASLALQKVPLLCRMGRATLVLCGVEQLIKVLAPLALAAFGLAMPDSGSVAGGNVMAVQAAAMVCAAYVCFAVPITRYFPWMLGRFSKKQNDHKEEKAG